MALHASLIASLPCVPCYHASLVIMRPLLSCVPCYHASLVIMRPLLSCVPCYHASLVIEAVDVYRAYTEARNPVWRKDRSITPPNRISGRSSEQAPPLCPKS